MRPDLVVAGVLRRCRIGVDDVEIRIVAVDGLGQHRVAEAIDHVRELRDDRRIDRRVVADRREEGVDLRLDLARELLEDEVLVLHLGGEARRLEQALAVPLARPGWHPPVRAGE